MRRPKQVTFRHLVSEEKTIQTVAKKPEKNASQEQLELMRADATKNHETIAGGDGESRAETVKNVWALDS